MESFLFLYFGRTAFHSSLYKTVQKQHNVNPKYISSVPKNKAIFSFIVTTCIQQSCSLHSAMHDVPWHLMWMSLKKTVYSVNAVSNKKSSSIRIRLIDLFIFLRHVDRVWKKHSNISCNFKQIEKLGGKN